MKYAEMPISGVMRMVETHGASLIEITGGEPLLQSMTAELCEVLLGDGYEVILETNGTQDIRAIPDRVRRVVDVKCPGSGTGESFLLSNITHVTENDEFKFVLASIDDAEWARKFCCEHNLADICPITFSPVSSSLSYGKLADWMITGQLDGIRLGVQLHKVIKCQ